MLAALVIVAIWSTMSLLANPIGDFPLDDDWAYGRSVKALVETGDFRLSGWTATNLLSQVLWGALFALPFGYSFTALRLSTLTLGLLGVLATYGLLRQTNTHRPLSLIGAVLLAINPIYFALSNTFMNDVPAFALCTLSLYLLVRGLKNDSPSAIVAGTLVACAAILARQSAFAILIAFGCAYVAKYGTGLSNLTKASLPALAGAAVQLTYQEWLRLTMRVPVNYGNQVKTLMRECARGLRHSAANLSSISFISLMYVGLFLLPLLLIVTLQHFTAGSVRRHALAVCVISLSVFGLVHRLMSSDLLMPLHKNVLASFGIGPVILKGEQPPAGPRALLVLVTIASATGAVVLLGYFMGATVRVVVGGMRGRFDHSWLAVLAIGFVTVSFLPIGLLGLSPFGFYDRYLIPLLPPLMMVVSLSVENRAGGRPGCRSMAVGLVLMLAYGGFTVAATHDYLSWNRARWQALHHLMSDEGIPAARIDGGFEFNGWHSYRESYDDWNFEPNKSWYWVDRDDYVVSFNSLSGYQEVKRYSCRRWLPWGPDDILVLRKWVWTGIRWTRGPGGSTSGGPDLAKDDARHRHHDP